MFSSESKMAPIKKSVPRLALSVLFSAYLVTASGPTFAISTGLPKLCHALGKFAAGAAQAKERGVPIQMLIDTLAKKKVGDANRLLYENIIVDVYEADLSPDGAYLIQRQKCMSDPPKKVGD